MFGVFIYDLIFFSFPVILLALFGVVLYRYISAKNKNIICPGTFSADEIKKRKIIMIVMSVIVGVLAVIVIGISALMFLSVAYM